MEKEQMNETRRPASRMKPRPESPLASIDKRVLAEVKGGGFETNVGDDEKPPFKKSSGAFFLTVPAKEPSEAEEKHGEPAEN